MGLKLGERAICGCKRVRKSLSRILEMLLRLEIGRKLADTDGSKPGYFRSGVGLTEACLNLDGKVPWLMDKLAKRAIRSENTREHCIMMSVGI